MQRPSGLPQNALVVVADGEKALFLRNAGDSEDMNLVVARKVEHDNPAAQDWATDKPGRFNDGAGVQRSAVEDTDWHKLEKERFASDLADRLYKAAHQGRIDGVVIVASRVVLSALRKELHDEVRDRIILDIPKVLTDHPVDDIEKHLATALADAA